jgi:hypothetical protein
MQLILVLALLLLPGQVTALIEGTDYVGVALKRAGGAVYSFVASDSTVVSASGSGRNVFEVCNVNRPCDRSLQTDGICTVVTPTCNCLIWKGKLSSAGPVIQLRTPRFACVRFAVVGSVNVSIDWHLRKIGQKVPHVVLNTGRVLWQRSPLRQFLSYETYVTRLLLPQICKPIDVGPVCRSTTNLAFDMRKVTTGSKIGTAPSAAVVLVLLALIVFDVILQFKHGKREDGHVE